MASLAPCGWRCSPLWTTDPPGEVRRRSGGRLRVVESLLGQGSARRHAVAACRLGTGKRARVSAPRDGRNANRSAIGRSDRLRNPLQPPLAAQPADQPETVRAVAWPAWPGTTWTLVAHLSYRCRSAGCVRSSPRPGALVATPGSPGRQRSAAGPSRASPCCPGVPGAGLCLPGRGDDPSRVPSPREGTEVRGQRPCDPATGWPRCYPVVLIGW
jgi:hypothetical protein